MGPSWKRQNNVATSNTRLLFFKLPPGPGAGGQGHGAGPRAIQGQPTAMGPDPGPWGRPRAMGPGPRPWDPAWRHGARPGDIWAPLSNFLVLNFTVPN